MLATAFVALAFDPVQTRLEEFASRTVHGGQPSPYDVLRGFSGTLTGQLRRGGAAGPDGAGPRRRNRSRLVAGVGRRGRSTRPGGQLAAGRRPRSGLRGRGPAGRERTRPVLPPGPVRRGPARRPGPSRSGQACPSPTSSDDCSTAWPSQAGLVLRGTRLRAELELRLNELSARADELRVSRQRLVDAQDNGRRLLERDIHDGAQQHLVALAVNLRLADTLATRSPERAVELLTAQETAADDAVATLVQLSRGIYPPLLQEAGVAAALRARSAARPPPWRSSSATSAGTPSASRRRRTSPAWRRCRTPPSTPAPRRSGSSCAASQVP